MGNHIRNGDQHNAIWNPSLSLYCRLVQGKSKTYLKNAGRLYVAIRDADEKEYKFRLLESKNR